MTDGEIPNEVPNQTPTTMPGKNGGTLKRGGIHKAGPGRPPQAIRQRCADSFDRHIGKAEQILCDQKSTARDKLAALDLLGKYGGLQKIEHEHSRKVYREAIEEARKGLRLVG